MKVFVKGLLFAVVFLLIVFTILEAGIRISGKWGNLPYPIQKGDFNFEFGWQMPTDYFAFDPSKDVHIECEEFYYEYDLNSLGVREREIDPEDSSEIRLFIYGDSFVEGNGASYDSTWPRAIEHLMAADSLDASVYMTGVSSSDPFFAYSALKSKLLAYQPTHFIVALNDSDFDNYLVRGGFSRFQPDGSTIFKDPPTIYLPYKYSHLARFAAHQFLDYNRYMVKGANTPAARREASDSLIHACNRIGDLCLENQIEFLVVIHPTPHEVCWESEQNKSDVLFMDQSKIRYPNINMYPPLRNLLNKENCYDYCWRIDSHFNGRGYIAFGEMVYHAINEQYEGFWHQQQ